MLLGEVTAVDLTAKTVTSKVLERTTVVPYDSLLVAAGCARSYFGHDRFARYAPGMKSVDDALELRGRIFGAFELAELTSNEPEIDRLLTFAVIGAGPTGVELAAKSSSWREVHPAASTAGLALVGHRSLDPGQWSFEPGRWRARAFGMITV